MKKVIRIILVLLIFVFTSVVAFHLHTKEEQTTKDKFDAINVFLNQNNSTTQKIAVLRRELDNDEIQAVLKIESLGLNIIVVQTNNNTYYMDHDVTKKHDVVGSAFIDYRNTFHSSKIIIYGHNSKTLKTEFGSFEKYLNEEFVKENPHIELITDEEVSKWMIFSVMVVPNSTTKHTRIEFDSDEQHTEHLKWMTDNSIIKLNSEVNINDQLMTLQTCYYEPADSFLLINLKKVEEDSE